MLIGIIGAVLAVIIIIVIIVLIVKSGKDKKKEPDVSIMDVQNSGVPNNQEFTYGYEKEPTVVMPPVTDASANTAVNNEAATPVAPATPVENVAPAAPAENVTPVTPVETVSPEVPINPAPEPQKINPNEIKADSISATDSLNAAVPQSEKVEAEGPNKENKTVSITPTEDGVISDIVTNNVVNEDIQSLVDAPAATPVENVTPVTTSTPAENVATVAPSIPTENVATATPAENVTPSNVAPAENIATITPETTPVENIDAAMPTENTTPNDSQDIQSAFENQN